MDKRSVVAVLCLTAVLGAQELAPAALDLAALAKLLDGGELPAVRPAIPPTVRERCDSLATRLAPADIDLLVEMAPVKTAWIAAAVHVLGQADEARATAGGLLREIRACRLLEAAGSRVEGLDGIMREDLRRHEWLSGIGEAARRRSLGLGARLLREHPDDPAVGAFLLMVDDQLPGHSPARVRAEALRCLGAQATSAHLAVHAADLLAELDLDGAASVLAAIESARQPAALVARRHTAMRVFDLRRRLAAAKAQVELAKRPGLEGQIAHLRLLQAANADAAAEQSRALVAAQVPHALPFSILAAAAGAQGKLHEAAAHLERCAALSGRCVLTVAAMLWCKVSPLMSQPQTTAQARQQAAARIAEVLAAADEILAADDSEEAALLAWYRDELSWPEQGWQETLSESLAAALALQRALPESLSAYLTVLAAALVATDETASRAALLQPIPAGLAGLDEAALMRATVFVRWLLANDRLPVAAEVDQVLGDLERVQGDGRDAAYLRGVLAWSAATRPGGASDLMRAARAHFAAAQRGPAEVGMWPAACAMFVADAALGTPVQVRDLLRQRDLADPDQENDAGISVLSLVWMSKDASATVLEEIERLVAGTDSPAALAVLHSAAAVGHHARGDIEGSRRAAKLAMQSIASKGPRDLAHDRGVYVEGWLGLDVGFRGTRPRVGLDLRCRFWIVPSLPSAARCKQLAEGK